MRGGSQSTSPFRSKQLRVPFGASLRSSMSSSCEPDADGSNPLPFLLPFEWLTEAQQ